MAKQDKFDGREALDNKKQNAAKSSIFEDADLILEENIFDDDNLQNQLFMNANDDDKQAIVQIFEQTIAIDADDKEAKKSDGFEEQKAIQDEQKTDESIDLDSVDPKEKTEDQEQKDTKQKQEETAKNEEHKYGKFKNPEELLHAYGELEKEFTRRSQRLKELENAASNPFANDDDFKAAVDKFFTETPSAKAFAKDIANEIIAHPELKQNRNCLDIALTRTLLNKFRTPEQLIEDGQFLKDYVYGSKKIKDTIIAEYLKGVRDGEPPFTLGGGGRQFATSPKNPKTIEEAGFMFLKENK